MMLIDEEVYQMMRNRGVGYMCNTADRTPGLVNNAEVVRLHMGTHTEWPGCDILVIRAKRRIADGEEILIAYNKPTVAFPG